MGCIQKVFWLGLSDPSGGHSRGLHGYTQWSVYLWKLWKLCPSAFDHPIQCRELLTLELGDSGWLLNVLYVFCNNHTRHHPKKCLLLLNMMAWALLAARCLLRKSNCCEGDPSTSSLRLQALPGTWWNPWTPEGKTLWPTEALISSMPSSRSLLVLLAIPEYEDRFSSISYQSLQEA